MHILLELHRCGSHTVGSLSRSIGVAGANASSACKRLERQGLLMRGRDPRDERVVRLALTPEGLRTVQALSLIHI